MNDLVKFPSIGRYRHVINSVKHKTYYDGIDEQGEVKYDTSRLLPTLTFRGTVKLHGTNCAICFAGDKSYHFQSREIIITTDSDNAGFAAYMTNNVGHDTITYLRDMVIADFDLIGDEKITIFGEWCGGNIQKSVALNQLDKMFVIFNIRVSKNDTSKWLDMVCAKHVKHEKSRIYNIADFQMFEIDIDFANPEASKQELINLTMDVENECPVAKSFGVSGTGEGIVFQCKTQGYLGSKYWFKIKGVKHSNKKEKTIAEVDVEKLNSINEFVDSTVTENRLLQGLDHLREHNIDINEKATGKYIQWVFNDIMKEESDTLKASNLEKRDISKPISIKARTWFFDKLDNLYV